jgi:hypothetical protein
MNTVCFKKYCIPINNELTKNIKLKEDLTNHNSICHYDYYYLIIEEELDENKMKSIKIEETFYDLFNTNELENDKNIHNDNLRKKPLIYSNIWLKKVTIKQNEEDSEESKWVIKFVTKPDKNFISYKQYEKKTVKEILFYLNSNERKEYEQFNNIKESQLKKLTTLKTKRFKFNEYKFLDKTEELLDKNEERNFNYETIS